MEGLRAELAREEWALRKEQRSTITMRKWMSWSGTLWETEEKENLK